MPSVGQVRRLDLISKLVMLAWHTVCSMWKWCCTFIGVALMLWAGWPASAQAPDDGPGTLRALYRRPAIIPFPSDNPYSAAKAELGRRLFFEPILSASGQTTCATCHNPALAWGDGLPLAIGDDHAPMNLRTPTLFNVAWLPRLGWSGRFKDIESVGFVAITGTGNMNLAGSEAIGRLQGRADYVKAFAEQFGSAGISQETIEAALATYERTIVSGNAPFDRWIDGDSAALDASAKRGFALFNGQAGCSGCHTGWSFTDGSFHDIGVAQGEDVGRGESFPTSIKLRYAFKTPTLRDVARRAPYMHDGSIATLEAVIELYNTGGIARPSRSELIHPLGLTDVQKADLAAFLHTLTSDTPADTPTPPE